MNKAKDLLIAHRQLADIKQENAKAKDSQARFRHREGRRKAQYYAPMFFPKFRRQYITGVRIDNDPNYVMPEKVRWLTPWESFCYDVKKALKNIGGFCHGR